ncbi:MAG: prepilin peptidase [Pseudomonadota bacterium]|nr:prepilin peptidase [Pseudomonadota bacterium]
MEDAGGSLWAAFLDGRLAGLSPVAEAWLAAVAMTPPLVAAAVWDLRRMRIPNWLNALMALIFAVVGPLTLSPEALGWRVLLALVVLAAGFGLFALRRMGGGDVKMLAACALWVNPGLGAMALQLLAVGMLLGLGAVRLARALTRGRAAGWHALAPGAKRFPMGVSIAAAAIAYLWIVVALTR